MPAVADVASTRAALARLRELQRERAARRVAALERVRDALAEIGALGTQAGVLERSAAELGLHSRFDRVLVSAVRDGRLQPRALWLRDDDPATAIERLRAAPIRLEYPLVEAEVARGGDAAIVSVAAGGPLTPRALADWEAYVVVPLERAGLLHAGGGSVDAVDREVASYYADGLAVALERAALRDALRRHREELSRAMQRLGTRTEALEDAGEPDFAQLTPRELDVLKLLARGRTNQAIGRALLISEDTVKYHVKNLLRKLQATSRADAVARYLRLTAR